MTNPIFRLLLAFRWIMPVFYLGLGLGLLIYAAAYLTKLVSFAEKAFSNDPLDNALALLGLIDGALIAGLTVMVMTSGYAIFVDRSEKALDGVGPTTVGFAALKTKFAATITAIGAVNLIEFALDTPHLDLRHLAALAGVEVVLMMVTLAFAWIETRGSGKPH